MHGLSLTHFADVLTPSTVVRPALQMTPGAATPPARSPLAAASPLEGEQQAEQQQQQPDQAAGGGGKQRRKKGRHPVEMFFRTAGLAGVVGAVALQLLQHAGRAR